MPLDIERLSAAEYAVRVLATNNERACKALGTTSSDVEELCQMAHMWWYEHKGDADDQR